MPESAHARVVDALGAAVVRGALAPGAAVTLEDLQARFAVSRTAARDAMRVLEHLGLIEPRRRVGLVVRPRDDWAHLDGRVLRWRAAAATAAHHRAAAELRAAVLPAAAAACARHAEGAELDRLVALATAVADIAAPDPVAAHRALVRLLLLAGRNELVAALVPALVPAAGRDDVGTDLADALAAPGARAAHARLARALALRDPKAARAAAADVVAQLRPAPDPDPCSPAPTSGTVTRPG